MDNWKLELIAIAVGAVWTVYLKSKHGRETAASKHAWLLECIAAGVSAAYRIVVRPEKVANPGVKLPDEKRAEANACAKEIAGKLAGAKGRALMKKLGDDFVNHHIEEEIRRAKAEAKKGT